MRGPESINFKCIHMIHCICLNRAQQLLTAIWMLTHYPQANRLSQCWVSVLLWSMNITLVQKSTKNNHPSQQESQSLTYPDRKGIVRQRAVKECFLIAALYGMISRCWLWRLSDKFCFAQKRPKCENVNLLKRLKWYPESGYHLDSR